MHKQAPVPRPAATPNIILPRVAPKPAAPTRLDVASAAAGLAGGLAQTARNHRIPECPTHGLVFIDHPLRPGERVQVLCACQAEALEPAVDAQNRADRYRYLVSKFGEAFPDRIHASARMATVDDRPAKARGKRVAAGYLATWDERRKAGEGLYLVGDGGTGKTYLAAAIANELEALNWFTATIAATEMPAIFRDKRRRDIFPEMVAAADLLVIDDLGADEPLPYDATNLFNAINARLRAGKPLIVTANLGAEDLKKHYERCLRTWNVDPGEAGIAVGRILDRLKELCGAVPFIGPSQRGEGRHTWMADL